MKLIKGIAALALAMLLVACGGGGGSAGSSGFGNGSGGGTGGTGGTGGGATANVPTLTLSLQDSAGAALTTPSLVGTQNAVAVARVADAQGAAVPNLLVSFSSTGLTLTPTTGQVITDANGIARVQIRALDPFASGATTITAGSSVAGSSVSGSLAIGLGAATATLSTLTASATTVPAYQTIQVSVPATLGGTSPAVQIPVDFSTTCGTFDPPTATTDSAGIARSAYRNQVGTTACSGPQTLSAKAGTSTVTTQVTAQAPIAANIVFVSATPNRIYLAGSPGVSQSLLKFKLVDSNNNPVQGANINLAMTLRPDGAYLGANAGTTSLQQPTNSDGTVDVAVNAGPQPGPVQVRATLASNAAITNVSNNLAVASGLPVQRAFSLSVSTFNIEALNTDGVTTDITLRIADRLGNPVPDGTTVNFVAEGGQVVGSCGTTGAAANNTSSCSVLLSSQEPRPTNGRVTVLAWAQGEENFVDAGTPTNNLFDTGESFEDLGQPFLDKNENAVFDAGTDVTVGTVTAGSSSVCPAGSISVPGTCNGAWGQALVRAQAVITFSGSDAFFTNVTPLVANGPNRCAMSLTISDVNGNPMPAGATLAVASVKGGGAGAPASVDATFEGFGGDGDKVPNTSKVGGTNHSLVFSNCATPSAVQFKLSVATPRKTTTFFVP
jgi:hypothetical protein